MTGANERDLTGSTIVITGAGSGIGYFAAEGLAARGARIVLTGRNADRLALAASMLAGDEHRVIAFDLADPRAIPGAAEAIGLAVRKGVKRLVLLSGRGEPEAQRAEQLLQASGADWTIVRASWFMQNFSESMLLGPILAGEMALPVSTVREPFIHADDIADIVTAALTDGRHIGQVYEVTGPRALTFAEATAEIAKATGRPISYTTISPEEFMQGLEREQVPADIAALVNELFTVVLDGRNEYLTDGVQQALGRAPRDFTTFTSEAAATGIWEGVQ